MPESWVGNPHKVHSFFFTLAVTKIGSSVCLMQWTGL